MGVSILFKILWWSSSFELIPYSHCRLCLFSGFDIFMAEYLLCWCFYQSSTLAMACSSSLPLSSSWTCCILLRPSHTMFHLHQPDRSKTFSFFQSNQHGNYHDDNDFCPPGGFLHCVQEKWRLWKLDSGKRWRWRIYILCQIDSLWWSRWWWWLWLNSWYWWLFI